MKDPQEALQAARQAAGPQTGQPDSHDHSPLPDPGLVSRRLVEWAIIEPDEARVYSTRSYGRPITWLKRGLVRLLRQYLNEVAAQQSRFNAQVAAHVLRLEERVAELERRAGQDAPPPR